MEEKQKTFLNAILHETGERVMVTHDQKGSPFFVDINGKKYHIERLDLSEALPPAIPMMGESEQMKSLTDIMKTFDVKEQDDHRAKIYPEFAGSPDDADDNDDVKRRCVKFKLTDGEIVYNAVMGEDEMMKDGGTPLMHACAKAFYDFRKEHPEVTEMHFYTDELVEMEEEEGD